MKNNNEIANDKIGAFIDNLLDKAVKSGIACAEAYMSSSETFECNVEDGRISQYEAKTSGGLALRGIVNGKMGISHTEAFDDDAIDMLVARVKESAELIEDPDEQFLYSGGGDYHAANSRAARSSGEPEKIAFALELEKKTLGVSPYVKKLGAMTGVSSTTHETRIVGTNGLNLSHKSDVVYAYATAVASKDGVTQDASSIRARRSLYDMTADELANEAANEAVCLLDAKPCATGKYKTIIRYDAMAALLGTFAGIFSAENTQKNLSLLKGKVGEIVASDAVTLVDDPLLVGGLSSRGFDDEGVPTYTKNVIEGGRLVTLLHNLKTAKKDGVATTGNGAKGGYSAPVRVAPFNFFFKPGKLSLDELTREIGSGIVITDLQGLHSGANAATGDFSLSAKGRLVEDGAQTAAVDQITIAGNFYDLLKNIVSVGSDLTFPTGGVGSPSIYVGDVSVAGR